MKYAWSLLSVFLVMSALGAAVELRSPDGHVAVVVEVKDWGVSKNALVYRMDWRGQPVIAPSRLGIELAEGVSLRDGFAWVSEEASTQDSTWKPVYGEQSEVRDHYNQVTISLRQQTAPGLRVELVFRCYDAGMAFHYVLRGGDSEEVIVVEKELTEFRFEADHAVWTTNSAQGKYEQRTLRQVGSGAERPITVQVGDEFYAAVGEAKLVDYARMKFAGIKGSSGLSVLLAFD